MRISYNKLQKLMIDNQMKRQDLMRAAEISSSVATKLNKNEIVSLVPMIDVKVDKGKKETSLAEIALVSLTSKITNLITTLDFVQTEPVSDIVKETSYRVYFISDSNEKISNENIVIADKKDKDTTKRMFRLRFNFKNKKYDKSQKYYLVAYDDKNDIEVLRHEIIMDIAFADDFGFFT